MKTAIGTLCMVMILSFCFVPRTVLGFLPPVDIAGPLTVRIEGPDIVSQAEVPVRLVIVLESKGDRAIRGTVRVQVIDRWRVQPAEAQPFTVEPLGMAQVRFTATAGQGTFNAPYPIHAYAEFEWEGKKQVAHPILMVQAQLPSPPRPQTAVEWKPAPVRADGALALWRLPARRVASRLVQQEPLAGAPVVQDPVPIPLTNVRPKDRPGEAVRFGARVDRGGWREGLAMRLLTPRYLHAWEAPGAGQPMGGLAHVPPLTVEGSLEMAQAEYPVSLPKTLPIRLLFANAVSDGEGSASVMFRIRVVPFDAPRGDGGKVVFEQRTGSRVWKTAEVDLSAYAGQNIRLQLESAGDQGGSDGIEAYWAEPTVVAGRPAAPAAFPPPPGVPSRALGSLQAGGERYEALLWPGRRGLLDSVVALRSGESELLFQGFRISVLGDQLEEQRSISDFLEAREEQSATGRYKVRHRFNTWAGSFDLLGEMWTEGGVLRVRFWLENTPAPRPWLVFYLEDVAAGCWNQKAGRVYFGHGNVLVEPGAFRLDVNGRKVATSFVGFDFANGVSLVQGVDIPPTDLEVDPEARIYTLHSANAQTMTLIPSRSVWSGVKVWRDVNGLKAAGGVAKKAGRFVFDIWSGGRYSEGARALAQAFRYRLIDSIVAWHTWQRWGYDFRLPDIYPPNPELGSLEEFRGLVDQCTKNGVFFAPHDNYNDYYPDAEGFSYEEKIAFTEDRQPVWAWYTGIHGGGQSYNPRSDQVRPLVERNMRLLREGAGATSIFIDCWTSLVPYSYWTHDGRFFDRVYTRNAWGEAFAWIRNAWGGDAPMISEAGNDLLVGWLDGADAQHVRIDSQPSRYGITLPCADSERVPWMDAAHHDRFILHGSGYEVRYASGLDPRSHGIYSDDYITTEVLTGHPPMVDRAFGREVVRQYWLLHDPMRALALRRIESVQFPGGNIHRQQVEWDNGAQVWVNRDPADWKVDGHVLPEFGYYARIPGKGGIVESAIERRDGVIVEWSRSPSLLYSNARPVVFDPIPQRRPGSQERDPGPDPRPARMNPEKKPISFGALTTDGACRVMLEGGALEITPLPGSPAFRVRIRWKELPWQLREPREAEALDENGKATRRLTLEREAGEIVLACEPGVFAYRLR